MRIVLATNNLHKVREMQALASAAEDQTRGHAPADAHIDFVSPRALGYDFSAEETGADFRANALIKARACYALTGLPSLGDDSGLVVRALSGRPGVHSARYAGGHGNTSCAKRDAANIRRVLDELAALEESSPAELDRSAAFVCALAFIDASGNEHFFDGQISGVLTKDLRGTEGFGYDPVFYVPSKGCAMAELPLAEKNELSHRARAFRAFLAWLRGE